MNTYFIKRFIARTAVVLSAAALFCGCSDDDETSTLHFDKPEVVIGPESSTASFILRSDTSWKLHSDADWFTLNLTKGAKSASVIITYSENTSMTEKRTAVITAKTLSGEIAVVSKTGESTTFTLSLPEVSRDRIVGTEAQAGAGVPLPEAEEETRTEAQPHDEGDRAVILVVDDEEQIRDLIGEILGGEYTVLRAADGVEAIDILKRRRPDLIISDISMPNLDGLGLLRYLKENEITRYIPFVFLTFKTDVEQEIHGYELGGEAYISKPFHPKHLLAVVHRILTDRQSLRNYYNSAISTSDVYEGSTIDADDKKFIVQLTRTIEENLVDENLSLNFLCDKMCVSRMGLYRKIKEITQMTPSEYIRSVKLKHATHLLRTTGMTIQEIMFCSGFNNKSYFYREFAKVYRMSPKEMREKER